MSKRQAVEPLKLRQVKKFILAIFLSVVLLILLFTIFEVAFLDKFFPRVYIGDSHLVFLTINQAERLLTSKYNQRREQSLQFNYNGKTFTIDLATASANVNTEQALTKAFSFGHSGHFFKKLNDQFQLLLFALKLTPQVNLSLDPQVEAVTKAVYKPPQDASLDFQETEGTPSSQITIKEAKLGTKLDKDGLEKVVKNYLIFGQFNSQLPIKEVEPKITTNEVKKAKEFLESISIEPIKLVFLEQSFLIDTKQLLPLLNLEQPEKSLLDQQKLKTYISSLAQKINQPVKEGRFEFDPAQKKVLAFSASQEGRELEAEKTSTLISLALEGHRPKTITLPVKITQPKIQTEQVNDLGVKELIGRGISYFTGSISNRIYNIQLAASRINGVLIPPGEVFSFNEMVGDISAQSGYKQAYVIKQGRTVLDDGGGVCQDSTTLFRAVLNAGLPIVQRVAHAYRVGFYEIGFPPGLDATVWAPSVDFKFKNDTSNHILIQAYTVGAILYVDLYGTSDGRVATISKPVIANQTPPPPEQRQDDPTLLKGTVKQVDFPAWGANVTFSRTVKRGGEIIINETFRSNFRPWQAVYLVGTKEN